jgi:4-aminobutyrate aminotransferase-like enzyme
MTTRGRPSLVPGMLAPGEEQATVVVRGLGTQLTLADGRVVIDAGSLSSCIVGHCHPVVADAIARAARTVYINDGTGFAPRGQAAEDLLNVAFAGEDWAESVAFFVSASEAVDLGLLLSQELTGRAPLACRELAYHGAVGLARAVSVHPLWSASLASVHGGDTTSPIQIADVRRLPVPVCGLSAVGSEHSCEETCLATAAEVVQDAAAVIMDYSQGAVVASAQYQDTLAAAASAAGALWIADETVTGFGRMGHGFAFQRGASRPDIVAMGKGLSGGSTAVGALVLSRRVVEMIDGRRWTTSSTFRGNPIAAAAISATMRVIADEGLPARAAALGPELGRDIRSIAARHACVERVVGEGLLWLITLKTPPEHTEGAWHGGGSTPLIGDVLQREALDHGVFIGVQSGQSVWIIPPLIITRDELDKALEALEHGLLAVDRALERAV